MKPDNSRPSEIPAMVRVLGKIFKVVVLMDRKKSEQQC
jgi:hypothetical protein